MRGVDCSTSLQQGPVRVWGGMVSRDVRCTCRFMVTLCALSLAPISPASQPAESDSAAHWSVYFEKPNGDTYFFQEASSRADRGLMQVWRRIQFGASVMGAYSYQDLVEIDCSGGQEKILQVTFFSDRTWRKPAMATDTHEKPARDIQPGDPTEALFKRLCRAPNGAS